MGGQSNARWTRYAVWWVLLLGLAVLATAATNTPPALAPAEPAATDPATDPFLAPDSTVVLLVGLPGDAESELRFNEELQAWLEILTAAQVERVFVLCDNPNTLSPRPGVEAAKADRAHFLELGPKLARTAKRLSVIAWGHGGEQGRTPVFHVRGPRLMPADVQEVAGRAPAASRWVLFFPGSGAFASQLAGGQRQILASDDATTFSSDPVGLGLLLKIARANPRFPLKDAAEELGRATAAWYAERNLARTEEPTLWLGDEPARRLAPGAALIAQASSKADAESKPATAGAELTHRAPAPTAPAAEPSVSSPAWKAIVKVEPREYPDADAVILRQRLTYTLTPKPGITAEKDQFVQILTLEGRSFGDFDVAYSPPAEDLEFLDAEVLEPDGKLLRLDPEAIRQDRQPDAGDYSVRQRKFFSLPGVVPGAVLHVRYRTEWKQFPLPCVSMAIPLREELPALDTRLEIDLPKAVPFHFAFERVTAPDPLIQRTDYSTRYAWQWPSLPAYRREVLSPPGPGPRLVASTFADWPAFGAWYARISQLSDEVTPEIAARAKSLTQDAKTDRERMLALYNYVTRLRYVAVPLGVNSFRPHAAARVLQNQFGDCKDKACLFNALVHALQLEARLVLVPRFTEAHDSVPGLAFNHAISCVTLEGKPVWVDTTDDVCRFGLLPPGDSGQKVLVIDAQTTGLTQLPTPMAGEHQLKLDGRLDCSRLSGPLPATFTAVTTGYLDYALRQTASEERDLAVAPPLLASGFRLTAGSFALEKQTSTPVSALEENFTWHAEGTAVGLLSLPEERLRLLHIPFWLPTAWDLALHRRESPLFLQQGYPVTLDESLEVSLPPGAGSLSLPGTRENAETPLRWRIGWARLSDDRVVAKLHAELAAGALPAAQTLVAQQQFRDLLAALASAAILSLPP